MTQAKTKAWQRCLLSLAAAALATTLGTGSAAAAAAKLEGLVPGSAAEGIYGSRHLAQLPDKAELVYDYRFEGSAMEKAFADDVLVDFSRQAPGKDGEAPGFDVEMTIFPHSRNQTLGPLTATTYNPILLVFFQRDVTHMSNGTGGSQHYFRNVIRQVMQDPKEAEIKEVTITLDGRQVAARQVSFRPFVGDSHRAQLRGFAEKTYRVTLSEEVPGGVYEVQSETPDEKNGGVLLKESYRFREIRQ